MGASMTTLIDRINERFRSGNDVPVDSVRVTAEEWEQIRSRIERLYSFVSSDPVAITYQTFGQYRAAILKILSGDQ
jgi:hypothetical protein